MKISNKLKMILCFVLAVLEGMMIMLAIEDQNTKGITANLILLIFLVYGGFQFKKLNDDNK